jgi:hypothetical protein
LASRSPGSPKVPRARFEEFVKHVLAVPKAELDARLDEEKHKKRERPKRTD